MEANQIIAHGRRYAKEQQIKIDFQRERIRKLESRGYDAEFILHEKQTLGTMIKSLDTVLERLRPFIEGQGRWLPNR
jgi:hypothetical protein